MIQSDHQIHPIRPVRDEDVSFRDQVESYLIHWKWFLISIIFFIGMALIYLRYTTPKYSVSSTIMIRDKEKGAVPSEFLAFQDIGLFNNVTNSVDNEIEVLKSRTLMENVAKKLQLNVSYFVKGSVRASETYANPPIQVDFSMPDSVLYKTDTIFSIKIKSAEKFVLFNEDEEKLGEYGFAEEIDFLDKKIRVFPRFGDWNKLGSKDVDVIVQPLAKVTLDYRNKIEIAPMSKNASVLQLSLVDPVKQKAEDVLNTLIEQYNIDVVADKNLVSENTAKFIEKRLTLIQAELGDVEGNAESFKETNKLTDIAVETELVLGNVSEYSRRIVEAETQLELTKFLIDYLEENGDKDGLMPANMGTEKTNVGPLIVDYNKLIQEKNRLMGGSTKDNPIILALDEQILKLRRTIKETLNNLKASQQIALNDLKRQENLLNSRISSVPSQEREYRSIERQQQIKETLYLYLLQKKEETAISLEVTTPNSKIIDSAYGTNKPVSPNVKIVLLVSLVLGFMFPFGIIYLKDLLDTKVQGRKDIEGKLSVPFLGDIPKSLSNDQTISKDSRSSAAEAFRILRTNLDFMLANVNGHKARKIFITSTVSGEGKTFVSMNLAGTLAISGKRVLLIGMDIRNPKLTEYIDLPHPRGLTNYLTNGGQSLEEMIFKYEKEGFDHMDILTSGAIPPNPAELLMSDKIGSLFAELEDKYDYIVVDTAPVSLVTDTLLISKYADLFVYVCRAGYLDKRLLVIPENLYREKRLPNMAMLINDSDSKKGYGYGYGYGYGQEVKPWWKKIMKKYN